MTETKTEPKIETRWTASGFLYGDFMKKLGEKSNEYRVFLVTNRHVLDKKQLVLLRFNPHEAKAAQQIPLLLRKPDSSLEWTGHPDPKIDVAVIPINPQFLRERGINFSYFASDTHVANIEKAKEIGVTEGDGVFALGFPLGLVGEERNYVIVRQGAIARIRDVLARSTKEFLVDIPVFPGNSGGPVVLRPEISSIQGTQSQPNALLLGMVRSYVPYQERAISEQTQRARIIFEENSGLAEVIPVDFIKETIEHHRKTIELKASAIVPAAK